MTYKKYKYISIFYHQHIESVAQMFAEHYDIPEYNDTLFLLNMAYFDNHWLSRDEFTESKAIFYNLEHFEISYNYFYEYFMKTIKWLNDIQIDDVWDFSIENFKYWPDGYKPKFVPMRYTRTIFNDPFNIPKKYDLGLVGVIQDRHPHRQHILSDIQYIPEIDNDYYNPKFKLINGYPIYELKSELSDCKYILDTLNNRPTNANICTQNQVRIFECIMRGYNVITEEVNGINYFPGCVKTFEYPADDERIESYAYGLGLLDFLGNESYQDLHIENREKYKELTYRDDDFENYKNNIIEQNKLLNT